MADILKATSLVPPSFLFNGKRIRPGERFVSTSPRMTQTLLDIRYAIREPDLEGLPPLPPEEASRPPETRKRGRPRKNQYGRRDMRAED